MPPQYALLAEKPHPADYSQRMVDLVASLETLSPASPEGVRLLCDNGITHIYIGQRRGEVGMGAHPLLYASDFENNAYELIYHQDLVYIFKLKSESCSILKPTASMRSKGAQSNFQTDHALALDHAR